MSARHNVATLPLNTQRRPRLTIGQTVGRYTLTEVLGSGAMGVVYRAFDSILGRHVALKSLHVEDERSRRRFVQEARAMARISHPNVVQVYDVVQTERADGSGDQWLIAMELVEGVTLERWLATPRSEEEIREVFVAAGRGLAAAHAAGLVHRDFKPANVLVGHDGRARVTDFGLTLTAEDRAPTLDDSVEPCSSYDPMITFPGLVVGTPAYMAPEQHRGAEVSAATDQFSFCAALYEALYGARPFDGRNCTELSRQKHQGVLSKPKGSRAVSRRLKRAVMRGLTVEVDGRFSSMNALLEKFEAPAPARRSWLQVAAALVLLAGGTALGAAWGPLHSADAAGASSLASASGSASSSSSASVAVASSGVSPSSPSRWR